MIVDEVKSLYRLPSLPDLMAEGRGFGACVVLGFQDLAQLRDVYGADAAKSMSAVLGTKVLFKIADPETARWGADVLGEVEEEMVKESTRYDAAGDTPKGVQLSAQRVQRHLVMPAELLRQERFHCFVQLSGAWPVAQTTLPHPTTLQRQLIAPAITPADPERSYAARIADVPDTPPNAAEPAAATGAAAGQPMAASAAASTIGKEDNGTAATPATANAGTPVDSSITDLGAAGGCPAISGTVPLPATGTGCRVGSGRRSGGSGCLCMGSTLLCWWTPPLPRSRRRRSPERRPCTVIWSAGTTCCPCHDGG